MNTYSYYHKDTGLFDGRLVKTNNEELAILNTPPDYVMVLGVYDPTTERIDVATGELVPYTPTPDAAACAMRRKQEALGAIMRLEAAQHRALRELAIDATDAAAKQRLLDLDKRIAALRADLTV